MAQAAYASGCEAFVDEDYDMAVERFGRAIKLASTPKYYSSRAAAHLKLENYTDAVSDASKCIELGGSDPKAHTRKGIACFYLDEFEAARESFEAAEAIEKDARGADALRTWLRKCDAEIADERGSAPAPPPAPTSTPPAPAPAPAPALAPAPAPAAEGQNYRHEWFQSGTHVTVTILAKGVDPDKAFFSFKDRQLGVRIKKEGEKDYVLQVALFGKIKSKGGCKAVVLGSKVEIKMEKAEAIQWTDLDANKRGEVTQPLNYSEDGAVAKNVFPSSNPQKKDWDKLEKELEEEEKDEKLEGDAALNKLFRDIYGRADEDTRRAMNKSFQQSNGTVLSTNWSEVGSKDVEGSAPSGMESRKYEH